MDILSLPNELIYQICEQMDYQSLARMIQTGKEIKDICSEILDKRHLEDLLSGYWYKCFSVKDKPEISKIYIRLQRGDSYEEDTMSVSQNIFPWEPPIFDDMFQQMDDYLGFIFLDDIKELTKLYKNLLDRNYIHITDVNEIWAHNINNGNEFVIYKEYMNFSKSTKEMSQNELNSILEFFLNIPITGNESSNELKSLIKEILIKRKKFLKCENISL